MRLLFRSLILLFTLIAVTGGTLLIGRAQLHQNPLPTLGFNVCNANPCFRGIISKQVTASQLRQTFPNLGWDMSYGQGIAWWYSDTKFDRITMQADFGYSTYGRMYLAVTNTTATIDDFVELYGVPKCIVGAGSEINVNYDDMTVSLMSPGTQSYYFIVWFGYESSHCN